MKLIALENLLAVCRFPAESDFPNWIYNSRFYCVLKSDSELSVVCESKEVPVDAKCEKNWKAFKVEGILDFSLTGILSSILNPLALAKISVFAISSFDTDYILVREETFDQAKQVLLDNGFEVL